MGRLASFFASNVLPHLWHVILGKECRYTRLGLLFYRVARRNIWKDGAQTYFDDLVSWQHSEVPPVCKFMWETFFSQQLVSKAPVHWQGLWQGPEM